MSDQYDEWWIEDEDDSEEEAQRIVRETNEAVREQQRPSDALLQEWIEFDRDWHEREERIRRLGYANWR